jgi:hypothetical protein
VSVRQYILVATRANSVALRGVTVTYRMVTGVVPMEQVDAWRRKHREALSHIDAGRQRTDQVCRQLKSIVSHIPETHEFVYVIGRDNLRKIRDADNWEQLVF